METLFGTIVWVIEQIWPGVLSSAVFAFIVCIVNKVIIGRSGYSGDWEAEIPKTTEPDIVDKKDSWKIKHRKSDGKIEGRIKRIYPYDDKRKWRFYGVIRENHMIVTYWSTKQPSDSRGCMFVTLDDTRVSSSQIVYRGQYYKQESGKLVSRTIKLTKK